MARPSKLPDGPAVGCPHRVMGSAEAKHCKPAAPSTPAVRERRTLRHPAALAVHKLHQHEEQLLPAGGSGGSLRPQPQGGGLPGGLHHVPGDLHPGQVAHGLQPAGPGKRW